MVYKRRHLQLKLFSMQSLKCGNVFYNIHYKYDHTLLSQRMVCTFICMHKVTEPLMKIFEILSTVDSRISSLLASVIQPCQIDYTTINKGMTLVYEYTCYIQLLGIIGGV